MAWVTANPEPPLIRTIEFGNAHLAAKALQHDGMMREYLQPSLRAVRQALARLSDCCSVTDHDASEILPYAISPFCRARLQSAKSLEEVSRPGRTELRVDLNLAVEQEGRASRAAGTIRPANRSAEWFPCPGAIGPPIVIHQTIGTIGCDRSALRCRRQTQRPAMPVIACLHRGLPLLLR